MAEPGKQAAGEGGLAKVAPIRRRGGRDAGMAEQAERRGGRHDTDDPARVLSTPPDYL